MVRFAGILMLLVVFAGCGGVAPTASANSLDGVWHSSSPKMSAHISGNTIKVYWEVNSEPQLYWKGTVPKSLSKIGKGVSVGDTKAMEPELLASGSSRKTFSYKKGKLFFTLTIADMSTVVYLSK